MALIFKYFFRFMKLLTIFHVVPSRYKFGFQFVDFICSCGLHIHILKKKPSLDCILLQSLIFCTDFKKEKYKNRYINCVILLQLPKGININLNWTWANKFLRNRKQNPNFIDNNLIRKDTVLITRNSHYQISNNKIIPQYQITHQQLRPSK